MLLRMANRALGDVGGTPGGIGEFVVGFVMACIGGYLLFNQVTIAGSYWTFWGANSFGISLIPLLFGVGILFWNARNPFGWLLTVGGLLFILAGVIANMHIYFLQTSLFNAILMLVLLVGGVVLIARSMRSHKVSGTD